MGLSRGSLGRVLPFFVIAVMAGPANANTVDTLQSLSHLFQSSETFTGPVADKVSQFDENFTIGGLDFSPDGKHLATNGQFQFVEVHIRDWRNAGHIERVLDTKPATTSDNAITYSPNGRYLAVGHNGRLDVNNRPGTMRVWDAKTWAVVADLGREPCTSGLRQGIAFTPDSKELVRSCDLGPPGNALIVYGTDTWEDVWGVSTAKFVPNTMALSPDGSLAALGGYDYAYARPPGQLSNGGQRILIVDLKYRKIVRSIEHVMSDYMEIQALSWSADGRLVAVGTYADKRVPTPDLFGLRIFDATTGSEVVREGAQVFADIKSIAYSSDGRFLVEAQVDGKVRIWDGEHRSVLQSIPINEHFHTFISISRDSRYLAIGNENVVSVWEFKPSRAGAR